MGVTDPAILNWDDLRYFLLAAQTRTLAGSARAAGVQHTTIGRRLTALEHALGAPLFLRGPDGLALTTLGEKLVPLVLDVERSVTAVRELATSQRLRVRVALPSAFMTFFSATLERFRQQHPELTLETVSGAQLSDLRHGQADMALRIGPNLDEELIARPLGEVGWSLYASPHYLENHPHPVNPQEITGHKVIGYGTRLATLPAARWIAEHSTGSVTVLSVNEIETMLDAAKSGVGIALLPCLVADLNPGLVRLTPQVMAHRELSLVYRREVRSSDPVRVTVHFLVQEMRNRAEQLSGSMAEASRQ